MRILPRGTLIEFWTRPARTDSELPLRAWFREVERAQWRDPSSIKDRYRSASFVGTDRVVFNIGGNKYRLVVQVKYAPLCLVYIRFVGTHEDYDRINVSKV